MISVDFSALVILALVFLLVLILGRLFFEPVAQAMETRQQRVTSAYELWGGTARAIEEIEGTRREGIQGARASGYDHLDRVRSEAQAAARQTLEAERERLRREIEAARAQLHEQGERAVRDLEAQADRLAAELAARVLGRKVA